MVLSKRTRLLRATDEFDVLMFFFMISSHRKSK